MVGTGDQPSALLQEAEGMGRHLLRKLQRQDCALTLEGRQTSDPVAPSPAAGTLINIGVNCHHVEAAVFFL